jgi:uncharacterized OsmC-like protein
MSVMQVEYKGLKNCELIHLSSGAKITTDAPIDNSGKGESFSPTDLLSASLGACMLTIMSIQLEPLGVDLNKSTCSIKKLMGINPRRVIQLDIDLHMCKGIPSQYRHRVEEIAQTCPVQMSLHPEIKVVLNISYPD